jgi:hypothetical protein
LAQILSKPARGHFLVRTLWREWTIYKPAAFGDWLWEVFVVQLAAFLQRLTLRQIIAFIPVFGLLIAYAHRIPLPPEIMLAGDLLAYIDVFSMIFLVGVLSRASTISFIVRTAITSMARLIRAMLRPDSRHQRTSAQPKRRTGRSGQDDLADPAVLLKLLRAMSPAAPAIGFA